MKTIAFTLVLFFAIMSTYGQKDPEAKSILEQAANKALAYKTIYIKFEFVVKDSQTDSDETYNGELWIKKDKFKMMVDNTITFSDGKSRWVYLPEVEEVNVTTVVKDEDLDPEERFLIEPLSIFTLFKNDFKYLISGSQMIDDVNHSVIDLAPTDLNKPYFKIKCWISDEFDYGAIEYFQKDGTRITLQLAEMKINQKLKDTMFEFDEKEHPDVEVIDLRD